MQLENNLYKIRAILVFLFAVAVFLAPFVHVEAAQMFVNSEKSTVSSGDMVRFRVGVNTEGTSINNGESVITFPIDLLQIVGVETGSSIFNLWVTNPTFSNTNGTITFNGGAANPGFNGTSGTVFWVTARAKKPGTATLSLGQSFIRANDGLGTNVLSSVKNATVNITKPVEKAIEPTIVTGDIVSPDTLFVAVAKNEKGEMVAMIEAHDDVGVDRFSVSIDDGTAVSIPAENDSATYVIPKGISEGKHILSVVAFDKAGNSKKKSVTITIDGRLPEISYITKDIVVGKEAHVVGATGMPETEVILAVVFPSRRLETYLIMTDENGKLDFKTEPLSQIGKYTLWIQKAELSDIVVDGSDRVEVTVHPTWLQKQIYVMKPYLALIVGVFLGIGIIIFLMRHGGYRVIRVPKGDKDFF